MLTGLRGRFCISPNRALIATTNLVDGVDWYSIRRLSDNRVEASFISTTQLADDDKKIIIPIKFIHGGSAVAVGSSVGSITILDVTNPSCISIIETLLHGTPGVFFLNLFKPSKSLFCFTLDNPETVQALVSIY
jgi:hypothetical protein